MERYCATFRYILLVALIGGVWSMPDFKVILKATLIILEMVFGKLTAMMLAVPRYSTDGA